MGAKEGGGDMAMEMFHEQTRRWFEREIGSPTPVQEMGWPVIARGTSALISAPTGTGKTLTAFLWHIDRLTALAREGTLRDKTYVLYITPLKALGNDIECNLRRPLEGIQALDGAVQPVRVAVRNGDTTAAERQRMLKHPPHILITTPESLYLLLTAQSGRNLLLGVESVIVDELHALIDSKRGVHLMLSLERLNHLCGRALPRVGLSATVMPLATAAACLAGCEGGAPRPVEIVAPAIKKMADMRVALPVPDLRALPEGTIWPEICRALYEAAQKARTTLVFCEGRATAEKVAHALCELGGEGFARTHHGCIAKEQRLEAERQLKRGELRVLCATSSMELGIDVGEIDLVAQIGAPTSISRATQRLGRAGHRPGETSVMRFYPRMADDLLADAFVARGALEGAIEPVRPPELCLDVLAQHLVSMAVAGAYAVDEALIVARGAYSFRQLSKERLEAVLRMLAGDFEHAADAPARPRVQYDRIHGTVAGDGYSRMLALQSGGTIPDRGFYAVVLEDGATRLGELEEEFVFEARVGDRFILGAFTWQILQILRDRVIVRPCPPGGAQAPFWRGDGAYRPYETGLLFGGYLRELEEAAHAGRLIEALGAFPVDADVALNAARHVQGQLDALGALATDRALVLEHFADETGEDLLLIHSVFGRRVNLPLGLLLQKEASAACGGDVRMSVNDDGILLHLTGGGGLPDALLSRVRADTARQEVARLLPAAPLYSMSFRYNANRALMMGVRAGGRVPLWVQRLRGAEAFSRALNFPDHPLLWETLRECLSDYMDLGALETVLKRAASGEIAVLERRGGRPSPMALSLRRAFEAVEMYDYDPIPAKAHQFHPDAPGLEPDEQAVREAAARKRLEDSPAALHERMMIEGDLVAGEAEAPLAFFEALAAQGRALYVDPGLWICAEQAEEYRSALEQEDGGAQKRIARRCLRYRGPLDAEALTDRYQWPLARSQALLAELEADEAAVRYGDSWVHAEVYGRAQRQTVKTRRAAIQTAPAERYAALLMQRIGGGAGAPAERLERGIGALYGLWLPVEQWEGLVLPSRTLHYRPNLLDELLASGGAVWRLRPGERNLLAFFPADWVDWACDPEAAWRDLALSEAERQVLRLLAARGASFAHALPAQAGAPALEILQGLAARGLVTCDSFAPLRALPANAKQRARSRAALAARGRWELARPIRAQSMDERLDGAMARWAVLSRETAKKEGIAWPEALERLRALEYQGKVRRGYFVAGMSGAQFVRAQDFERVTGALAVDSSAVQWVCAADPLQPWGPILKQPEDASFLCVPGTALAMCGGRAAALFERQGESLRLPGPDCAQEALRAFCRAFSLGQIYPHLRSVTVKQYPAEAGPLLESAGFSREMRDYVLWR